jgi:hypothetical protein
MSTGLLDFLDIEEPEFDWIREIGNYLKLRFIVYNILSNHIKFNIDFLIFDIWFEDRYYFVRLEKNNISSIYLSLPVIDFLLFGLIKPDRNTVILKHTTIKDILNLINNMSTIIKSIKKSKYFDLSNSVDDSDVYTSEL